MTLDGQKALLRILILTILFTSIGTFVLWDYVRVDRDFSKLKALLQDTRYRAIGNDKTFVVRFSGEEVVVSDKNKGSVIKALTIPTLDEVNYDTTHGTSKYNKREHGGDLRLKSWFGFRKNLAINCTGLIAEGVYPAEWEQKENNPKGKVDKKMEPTPEKISEYIKALESANKHLVFSLKKCLALLANVPPQEVNEDEWQAMLLSFNKIVKIGEKVATDKPLH